MIDEAHNLKNRETHNFEIGKLLRQTSEYVALLTATPIMTRSENLHSLLEIIDPDQFKSANSFEFILEANRPLIKLHEELLHRQINQNEFLRLVKEAKDHWILQSNQQLQGLIDNPPTDSELSDRFQCVRLAYNIDKVNLLGNIVTRTRRRFVDEFQIERVVVPEIMSMTVTEQQLYHEVTQLVKDYCYNNDMPEGFMLVTPQRQLTSSMPAALEYWIKKREELQETEEELFEDLGIEDNIKSKKIGPLTKALLKITENYNKQELRYYDSKFNRLLNRLKEFIRENVEKKIIIFSYFRATLDYLAERLEENNIKNLVIKGGMKQDKSEVVEIFRDSAEIRVLLSSEVGSEGIDLQFCHFLVNYDLPWNPMRVEQRIGRIDRLGQKEKKIVIWNLLYDGTIDSRIYHRLHERLDVFRHALGGLEEIIGQEIRELTKELFNPKITEEQEENLIERKAIAIENRKSEEERLENQASLLTAHGDYILDKIKATKELHRWISGDDLIPYVINFFQYNYTGCSFEQDIKDSRIYKISLSNNAKVHLERFIRDHKLHEKKNNLTTLTNSPFTYIFENNLKATLTIRNTEIINQFHPVIRFITDEIRKSNEKFYKAIALKVSISDIQKLKISRGTYVFAIHRTSIQGIQTIEKLFFAVSNLTVQNDFYDETAEKLINIAADYGKDWDVVHLNVNYSDAAHIAFRLMQKLNTLGEQYVNDRRMENEDRINIQIESVKQHYENQSIKYNEIIFRHTEFKRDNLKKATEAKMNNLKNRTERTLIDLEEKRKIKTDKEDICAGLIHIF